MLLNREKRRFNRRSEGSWAVSYVDMLTLLLCFFIIFYNSSNSSDGNNLLIKISNDLNNEGIEKNSEKGSSKNKAISRETALLTEIESRISRNIPANIKNNSKHLEISFEGLSFFKSGSTSLLPIAEKHIKEIIESLKDNIGQVRITVQGHTDPVKARKTVSYSDNWELSAIRATSVLKLFIKNGYPQELLSAEGFADTRTNRKIAELSKEELANLRKITLRIEPVRLDK